MRSLLDRRRLLVATLAIPGLAHAQDAEAWPQRRVRLIAPAVPGSSLDLVARLVGEGLAARWGQPVAVENRPGADAIPALEAMLAAPPGEALMMTNHGALSVTPILHPRLAFDPMAELVPICDLTADPFGVTVSATLPAPDLAGLVALLRDRPGTLNWTAAPGPPYLAMRAFLRDAGDLRAEFVAFRGVGGAVVAELSAGRIQFMIAPVASFLGAARDGPIRALAVTGDQRATALPQVPTTAEAGFPTFRQEGVHGLVGWKGMPPALAARLASEAAAAAAIQAERLRSAGLVLRPGGTPMRFAALLDEQRRRWAGLVREFGTAPG